VRNKPGLILVLHQSPMLKEQLPDLHRSCHRINYIILLN
jgi:hypothetical protein